MIALETTCAHESVMFTAKHLNMRKSQCKWI